MTAHDEQSTGGRAPLPVRTTRDNAESGTASATADATGTEANGAAPDAADSAGSEPPPSGRRRGSRRTLRVSLLVLAAVTAVGAAGVAATGAFGGDGGTADAPGATGPQKTANVERTTLTRTETVDGTLGFGTPTTVQQAATDDRQDGEGTGSGAGSAQPSGGSDGEAGIVTWLPEEGATLSRGETVYSVDEQKVPLLYGDKPFYRTMRVGTEGNDVETLEKNLAELDYTGFTVDEEFTSGTAAAVRDWQDDMHRQETGEVAPGDAVVASGARRVAERKTTPGASAGGEALTWTGTDRIVDVELEAGLESLVKEGTKATVGLPDGGTAEAEVTDIGTPAGSQDTSGTGSSDAGSGDGGDGGEGGTEEATLPVQLKLDSQQKLDRYQAASVDVTLKAQTRENVLAVPVNALLAQPGGGYAVETADADGRSRRIPVELGMFADGEVEVSGKGIKEGLDVGVPR